MRISKPSRTSVALHRHQPRRSSKALRPQDLKTSVRHPAHATSELIDVVNLVTQAFWAELRGSGETIEISQWSTLKRIGWGPCTMSELARHKGVGLPTIS